MKRPLALFGLCFFLVLLAAARWPAGALLALAVPLAAAFLLCAYWYHTHRNARFGTAAVLLCAAALALAFLPAYNAVVVRPVRALVGNEAVAGVHVRETATGYGDDETVQATLRVTALDGKAVTPFTVQVYGMPPVQPGDELDILLRFSAGPSSSAAYRASKGIYIGAEVRNKGTLPVSNPDLPDKLRLLQYRLGERILGRLPKRLSSVTAAMVVGDRRFLDGGTKASFRMAGLSHMLVVSGLHMGLISSAVYGLALWLSGRRRRVASAAGLVFVWLFALFNGLTPSILRCAVLYSIVYAGNLLYRKADAYTSLGFALLLLCLQNPYAVADMGLQLSFVATLGMLLSNIPVGALQKRWQPQARLGRALRRLACLAIPPTCVALAVLPVLALNSGGFSLLTVPMNILAVPLLMPIIATGLFMALPGGPLLNILLRPLIFLNGLLQVALERLTGWCAGLSWAYQPVGGAFLLVCILLVYGLVYLGLRTRRRKLFFGSAAASLLLAVALHLGLGYNTIHIVLVGTANPSVVVVQNRSAAILYRGVTSMGELQEALFRYGVREVPLLLDLRRSPGGTQYEVLDPAEVVRPGDYVAGAGFTPLPDVSIGLRRQGDATALMLEAGGYTLGLGIGPASFLPYGPVDILLAGSAAVEAEYGTLLYTGAPPVWAEEKSIAITTGGGVWIRPGTSVRYTEVDYGSWDG